jgi:hypothetical protein
VSSVLGKYAEAAEWVIFPLVHNISAVMRKVSDLESGSLGFCEMATFPPINELLCKKKKKKGLKNWQLNSALD